MIRTRLLHCLAISAVLALFAESAWGQKPRIVGQERPGTVKDWESRIAAAEELLRAGNFKKAQDISEALVREMLHRIESGPGTGPLVGQTLLVRALGAAGRNHMRDALWDWYSARAMNPELTEAELAAYGPVGETLQTAIEKQPRLKPEETDREASEASTAGGGVTRPKKIKGKEPVYPRALLTACTQGAVVLKSIIDQEGHVWGPVPLASPSPILTLAALETLRTWQFKPAVFQGKPVAVYYTATARFETRTCRNPAAIAAKNEERP